MLAVRRNGPSTSIHLVVALLELVCVTGGGSAGARPFAACRSTSAFRVPARRGSALRSTSPPRSTTSTCKCHSWRAGSASGSSRRASLPHIRSAGAWNESRGPVSASALRSCSCNPLIWVGSNQRQHFFTRSFESISLPSEMKLHEERTRPIPVDRLARLIHRHAVVGIRSDFNETSRLVERVSRGQEFQTFQPHGFVADRSCV
jgi:hypothetical protein